MAVLSLYLLPAEKSESYPEDYYMRCFPARYERAKGFKSAAERRRSLAAGVLLHEVLGLREEDITILPGGKPCAPSLGMEFNLSHSGEFALLAVSEVPVGADIEVCSARHAAVMKKVFQEEEIAWTAEDPEARFTLVWTMKEAVSKALGKGLALPFRDFSVLPLIRGERVCIEERELYGHSISIPGYSLSVCTVGKAEEVQLRYF